MPLEDGTGIVQVGGVWRIVDDTGFYGGTVGQRVRVNKAKGGVVLYEYLDRMGSGDKRKEDFLARCRPCLEHDTSNPYSPRGTLTCMRCLAVWAADKPAPLICEPTKDPRPPQVVLDERWAGKMAGTDEYVRFNKGPRAAPTTRFEPFSHGSGPAIIGRWPW